MTGLLPPEDDPPPDEPPEDELPEDEEPDDGELDEEDEPEDDGLDEDGADPPLDDEGDDEGFGLGFGFGFGFGLGFAALCAVVVVVGTDGVVAPGLGLVPAGFELLLPHPAMARATVVAVINVRFMKDPLYQVNFGVGREGNSNLNPPCGV